MKKLALALTLVLWSMSVFSQSQTLINTLWEKTFGQPTVYKWGTSSLDASGRIITVGHSTAGTGTTLLVKKQDTQGSSLWEKTFTAAANTKNYGSIIISDSNNNIYVAGVHTPNNSPDSHDYLIVKYDTDGVLLWDRVIAGSGQGDDIPIAMTLGNTGNIYLTGISKGTNSKNDYFTLKIDAANGQTLWQHRYDYAQNDDIPADIALDNNGNILVMGGSAQSALKWDMAIVKYSPSGNVLETKRLSNQTLEFNMPSDITKDDQGNFLMTGITSPDGTNFNIRTIKLSDTLGITWMQDFDSGAAVDSVCAIRCDPSGHAIVTGWISNANGGSEFITIKHDQSNGEILWTQKRTANPSKSLAKSSALSVDDDGNIFIAGEVYYELQSYISVMQYDANGNIRWEKRLGSAQGNLNTPLSLLRNDQDEIFVSGIQTTPTTSTYTVYKLQPYERTLLPVSNGDQNTHITKEIIVRFKPDIIDPTFIDNSSLRYARFGDVISDQGCLNAIDQKLDASGTLQNWQVIKVHRNLSTKDSLATTHLGKIIKVPDFYNTLVLVVPKDYQRIHGEFAIADSLQAEDLRCCIRNATPNLLFTLDCDPDDSLYPTQGHLHPNATYPNGHINMEPGWCVHTGKDHIRLGIVDSGVEWSHEDFGGTNGFEESVIVDGYDYTSNTPIENTPENDGYDHGTRVASVAAAIRNNGIGVAGMAGGDNNGDGVRLIVLKNLDGFGFGNLAQILEAYTDAMIVYKVHIINQSGGTSPGDSNWSPANVALFREQLHLANRMGITLVASRGNSGPIGNAPRYPGTAQDEWILCVGGTNTVGEYNDECSAGLGLDVAAPSRWQLTRTIRADGTNEYGGISFTSGAAPHVAGLAALMQSYYTSTTPNLHLVQEDIEYIIQVTADDVDELPALPGYDDETGHGKINAGAAMELIERSNCNILHFGSDTDIHTRNIQMLKDDIPLELTEAFTTEAGLSFDAGMYKADVYKVTVTVDHSLPIGMNIIEHYWERHSNSTVFKYYDTSMDENTLQPLEFTSLIGTPSSNQAVLEGYVYLLKDNNCSDIGWIPAPPEEAVLSYSLLACMMTSTTDLPLVEQTMELYPNPVLENLTIEFDHTAQEDFQITITSIQGSTVQSQLYQSYIGQNKLNILCRDYPAGLYFCEIKTRDRIITRKFIKQ